jgi:hypothetical protein
MGDPIAFSCALGETGFEFVLFMAPEYPVKTTDRRRRDLSREARTIDNFFRLTMSATSKKLSLEAVVRLQFLLSKPHNQTSNNL